MAKLTDEMKEFIKGKLAYIATIGPDGMPNVGPKGSFRVIDDEHLGWTEATFKHTHENLQKNPGVAVAVVERETRKGFRFKGTAELVVDGPIYEKVKQEQIAVGRPIPRCVVCVSVNEIYNIGFPTWERIA